MKYCLPLKEFNYSFAIYKSVEICCFDENKSARKELLNIFFNTFELKDLVSWVPSARISEWKKIFVNVLTDEMIKKIEQERRFNYGWTRYSLQELFKDITNTDCYTSLVDHSRMFLTKYNEPVLISTVYRSKEHILNFAKEQGLENFILDIVEVLNWRNPQKGSCLVLFNTNADLQERFNLYKAKAQTYKKLFIKKEDE